MIFGSGVSGFTSSQPLASQTARERRLADALIEGEEYMVAAIWSAFRRSIRGLATLRWRHVPDRERLTNSPRDGMPAWHFF
jgi:hypothetical protein